MRVLMKDREDATLMVAEATDAYYEKKLEELYLSSGNVGYTVSGIREIDARRAIQELFETGAVDLSGYEASVDA